MLKNRVLLSWRCYTAPYEGLSLSCFLHSSWLIFCLEQVLDGYLVLFFLRVIWIDAAETTATTED